MKKILIINAGQHFGHSGGRFNQTVTAETLTFFDDQEQVQIKQTNIAEGYVPKEEVEKFVWADVIIYHTPIWWFQVPHGFKKYIDEVFTAGHNKGIYHSDGRKAENPKINYGTGGMLHGRHYMLTTSWNAPETAFTLPGEFFNEHSVDEGPLFGFHRMNAFTGMKPLTSFHFHDIEKNANIDRDMKKYRAHLSQVFKTTTKHELVNQHN
ncbi:NADPH quinone reductase MdaB [Niastella koreensis]|uniref:NAD(P)H dehydrogenase (Quinone) n=2 Tax=Niastella koreensis TaxID=354356 RepID=G8THQ1_NIAKG|nr:NAD(P)H-dependent oxidoreductase [Niastella koreensis]AEV97479.1 NAD(P)H dehydrogenase (quinone) [Niastella koreensis GR20-10]OQP47702.1 NADPH quinone reductase MdaB [Niastella koreensis]